MKFKFITPQDHEYSKSKMLRWELLLKPLGLPPGSEVLPKEENFIHLVALDKTQVVGCVVFHVEEEGVGVIDQMAISEEYRGKGFGRKIAHAIEEEALKRGIKEIHIEANDEAASFYEALGYKKTAETAEKMGVVYQVLVKKIEHPPHVVNL